MARDERRERNLFGRKELKVVWVSIISARMSHNSGLKLFPLTHPNSYPRRKPPPLKIQRSITLVSATPYTPLLPLLLPYSRAKPCVLLFFLVWLS